MAINGPIPAEHSTNHRGNLDLRWIGEEHYKDRARQNAAKFWGNKYPAPPKPRSDRELARLAAERFYNQETDAERLRRKFRAQKDRELAEYKTAAFATR